MKRTFGLGILLPAVLIVVGSLLLLILRGRELSAARVAQLEAVALAGIIVALAGAWVLTGAEEGRGFAGRLRLMAPALLSAAVVAGCLFYVHGQAQVEEPLPDAYVGWRQYRSDHFIFVYPPDSPLRDDIRDYAARADDRYEFIVRKLRVGFDERITFFAYNDMGQAREVLGRDPGFGDPARLEAHALCDEAGGPEAAYVIACEGFGEETKLPLLATGLSAYLGDDADHWPEVMRLLQGRATPLDDLAAGRGRGDKAFRGEAGSFVKFLFETHGLKKLRRLWGARDLRGAARRTYGKTLDQLEDEWHGALAEMAGFRSLEELNAASAERVALNSEVGRDIVGLFDAVVAAHQVGDVERARRLLSTDSSAEARRLVAPAKADRCVLDWQVRRVTGYGNRCYIASGALVQRADGGGERALESDALVARRLGKMRILHVQPEPQRLVHF